MPEWCDSILDVAGPDADVALFRDVVSGEVDGVPSPLVLDTVAPVPADLVDVNDRLTWRVRYWGCKWEPEVLRHESASHGLRYMIRTPYAPPNVWLEIASRRFPTLSFRLTSIAPDPGLASVLRFRAGDTEQVTLIARERTGERWSDEVARAFAAANALELIPR